MAIHATPLTAYLNVKNANVDANQRAGAALGNIAAGVTGVMYEKNKKKFFESLGDSNEKAVDAQIEEIDAGLESLKEELAAAESELAALGGEN